MCQLVRGRVQRQDDGDWHNATKSADDRSDFITRRCAAAIRDALYAAVYVLRYNTAWDVNELSLTVKYATG